MKLYKLLLITALYFAVSSCRKEIPAADPSPNAKTTESLIVGLPPAYIWWSIAPNLPFSDGEPGDIPAGIDYTLGFAINGKGYVCGGVLFDSEESAIHVSNLYEYDIATQTYTEKAPIPGGPPIEGTVFVIGNDAYVVNENHLFQYDQPTNTWTQKASVPSPTTSRLNTTSFAVGGKGYYGLGEGITVADKSAFFKDWWEYDPTTDHWTQKNNFPGGTRTNSAGFAVDGFGYVCSGDKHVNNVDSWPNDLWQYNPVNDTWMQKANMPGLGFQGFGLNGTVNGGGHYGFVVAGGPGGCLEYNPATDKWGTLPNVPGGSRTYFATFMIGRSLFVGGGDIRLDMHALNWSK